MFTAAKVSDHGNADRFLCAKFDATEVHRISINASRQTVYEALWTADLGGSLVIKLLHVAAIDARIHRAAWSLTSAKSERSRYRL